MFRRELWPLAATILTLSLAGCGTPTDRTASGEAIPVPSIQPPEFDGAIGPAEYSDAWSTSGQFKLAWGTRADGTYPFVFFLGTSGHYLHVALDVTMKSDPYLNPYSREGSDLRIFSDKLAMLMDAGNGEQVAPPADYHGSANVNRYGGASYSNGYFDGTWVDSSEDEGRIPSKYGEFPEAGNWCVGANAGPHLVWECWLEKSGESPQDLDLRKGFRMALVFAIGGGADSGEPGCDSWGSEVDSAFEGCNYGVFPGNGDPKESLTSTRGWMSFDL